jgi:cell pole-organizing protein PopZ
MSNPQHEPTMEEILASIRKIISEDTPEAPAPEASSAPPPPPPIHDDILELTQEIEVMPPPPAPEPMMAAPAPMPEPVQDVVFEPVIAPAPSFAPAPALDNDIFSDHTRKAVEDTFNAIPEEPEEPAFAPSRSAAPIAPVDGASVENVFERAVRESFEPVLQKYLSDNSAAVIDRMKPLIREWMDEHFPALLEGAVRAEVERVVKARGTKR